MRLLIAFYVACLLVLVFHATGHETPKPRHPVEQICDQDCQDDRWPY